MKLTFSAEHVPARSFLELCTIASDYGYAGFEIYDADEEKRVHEDSILRPAHTAGAKRKLYNRHIAIPALTYPTPIENDGEDVGRYVEMAARAGAPYVIIRIEQEPDMERILNTLRPAIEKAERYDVTLLMETVGYLAHTQNVINIINRFATGALGAGGYVRGC